MDYLEEDYSYYGGQEEQPQEEEDIFAKFGITADQTPEELLNLTAEDLLRQAENVEREQQEEEQEYAYSFQQLVSAKKSAAPVFIGRRRVVSDEERINAEVRDTLEAENHIIRSQPRDKGVIVQELESKMPKARFYNVPMYVRAYLLIQKYGKDFTPSNFQDFLKAYRKAKKQIAPEDLLRYSLLVAQE